MLLLLPPGEHCAAGIISEGDGIPCVTAPPGTIAIEEEGAAPGNGTTAGGAVVGTTGVSAPGDGAAGRIGDAAGSGDSAAGTGAVEGAGTGAGALGIAEGAGLGAGLGAGAGFLGAPKFPVGKFGGAALGMPVHPASPV